VPRGQRDGSLRPYSRFSRPRRVGKVLGNEGGKSMRNEERKALGNEEGKALGN
jgi:hypothetical protein